MINRTIISTQIRKHKLVNPDKIAINYQDQVFLSYQTFMDAYDYIAEKLRFYDIDRKDRILVQFESRVNYLLTVLPCVETAIYTSAETSIDLKTLEERVNLYQITTIVSDTISDSLKSFASAQGCGLIYINFNQQSSSIIADQIVKRHSTAFPIFKFQDLALITQTSGTTATPKLIPKSYGLLVENCIQEQQVYDVDDNQIRLITAPIHRTNTGFSIIKFLYSNAQIICTDGVNHSLIRKLLENNGVTHLRSAPASISSFMDYLDVNNITLSCKDLQYIFVPGAAINSRFVDRVNEHFDAQLIHTYGSTETSNITSNYNIPSGYRLGSVGVAVYHDLKIIDGEVCVKGRTVFEGYENADNSEYFIDGYFRTGDSGFLDEEGYLYISGRIKEMINRGGDKVSPYELEKEVEQLGIFKEHAIFPYPGKDLSEEIGLVGVLSDEHHFIKLSEVRSLLMVRVPSFKLPTKLVIVDEIPKSANNKIQRKQLYSLLTPFMQDELVIETENGALLTETETVLVALYKRILNVSHVDILDNFIALGGDSLKANELYHEIETTCKVKLPLVELFQCGNVKEMAIFIEKYSDKSRKLKFIVPLVNKDNDRTPLIFVHAVAGDAITYRHLASKIDSDRSIYAIEFNISQSDWTLPPDPDKILDDYIKELLILRPEGTFIFSGLSMGGRIALEIAHRLRDNGYKESKVIMLDTVFVKGNKKGKQIMPSRVFSRLILDMKTKKHGNVFQYLFFRTKRFIQNRLAKKEVENFLNAIIKKKIASQEKEFTPAEIEILISSYFKTPIRPYYDIEVIYLLAKKEENTANAEYISPRVRNFVQIELDCYHSDFVSLHADETGQILADLIQT
jgi:oxalate---CoA ligase